MRKRSMFSLVSFFIVKSHKHPMVLNPWPHPSNQVIWAKEVSVSYFILFSLICEIVCGFPQHYISDWFLNFLWTNSFRVSLELTGEGKLEQSTCTFFVQRFSFVFQQFFRHISLQHINQCFVHIAGHHRWVTLAKVKYEFTSGFIYNRWKIWCHTRDTGMRRTPPPPSLLSLPKIKLSSFPSCLYFYME